MNRRLFDAAELEAGFAFLDSVPAELLADVLATTTGDLRGRAAAVSALVEALLRGEVPSAEALPWPRPEVAAGIVKILEQSGIAPFCRGQEALTTAVVKDLLQLGGEAERDVDRFTDRLLHELLLREQARRAEQDGKGRKRPESTEQADATRKRLRLEAERQAAAEATKIAGCRFSEAWSDRVRLWTTIEDMFGEVGDLLGWGRDLSRGVLRHAGWLNVARMREIIARSEQLKEVVRVLGRSTDDESASVLQTIVERVRRTEEELHDVRTPLAPIEMRGVERSGAISRMLPSEAVLLRHPALRLLWHARRAEQALLTYRADGVVTERTLVEREVEVAKEVPRPKQVRGPIIVCLDTSGSMYGAPETIAKAVTLEAMRTAHAEGRRCYLIAFSGPGDVAEKELAVGPAGLDGLLELLSMSFHGGTDVAGPLRRAVELLGSNGWKRSDVLLVTDGEFPVEPATRNAVADARKLDGARFHGLLIGSNTTLAAICDPVHRFNDWNAFGHIRPAG